MTKNELIMVGRRTTRYMPYRKKVWNLKNGTGETAEKKETENG